MLLGAPDIFENLLSPREGSLILSSHRQQFSLSIFEKKSLNHHSVVYSTVAEKAPSSDACERKLNWTVREVQR